MKNECNESKQEKAAKFRVLNLQLLLYRTVLVVQL